MSETIFFLLRSKFPMEKSRENGRGIISALFINGANVKNTLRYLIRIQMVSTLTYQFNELHKKAGQMRKGSLFGNETGNEKDLYGMEVIIQWKQGWIR